MTDINDFRNRYSRRLDDLRDKQQREALQSIGQLYPELAEQLYAWQAGLQQRQVEYEQEAVTRQPPLLVPPQAHPAVVPQAVTHFEAWRLELDRLVLEKLEFGYHPLPKGFAAPLRWFEDPQHLRQELCAAMPGHTLPQQFKSSGGIFHLPGLGTCINLAYYQNLQLQAQTSLHEQFASDLARERWGWGFMLEYTGLGQAAGQAGLWPALLAQHLGAVPAHAPDWHMAAVLQRSWLLLKTGWCEWIWLFAQKELRRANGTPPPSGFSLAHTFELLKGIMEAFPWIINILGGVRIHVFNFVRLAKFLFFEQGDLLTRSLHDTLLALDKFSLEHDAQLEQTLGLRLSDVLARLYMAQIEAVLGVLSTPYAVLVAMHTPALAQQADSAAMQALRESDLRMNPDTRLALLARSDSRAKYDPRSMSVAAWERFRLESPREYFHP